MRARRLAGLAVLPMLIGAAPEAPTSAPIADMWFAHNAVSVMLGASDRIRVTVDSPQAQPWLFRVAPAMTRAQFVENGSANAEALLADHVTLAFTSGEPEAARLRRYGLDARAVGFTDVAGLDRSLGETAAAIGTPLAQARLAAYRRYTGAVIRNLQAKLGSIPEAKKPRVLHLVSWSPLKADGADTIIDQWIRLAGGRNAADGLTGNQQPISIEQIVRWHPDIIIVGGLAKGPDDHPWANDPALKGVRIVRNPAGVYLWDRYGPEFALQLQWTAALLHPDRMGKQDMAAVTQSFYRQFYGYTLSPADADRILHAERPAE